MKQDKPNIVLVMCDDLGYGDTGFNGNTIHPNALPGCDACGRCTFHALLCRRAGVFAHSRDLPDRL